MKITGNEPANPVELQHKDHEMLSRDYGQYAGLTIRQQFAAMAMQGFLSCVSTSATSLDKLAEEGDVKPSEALAKMAVECADSLIAELNKEA